MQEGLAILFLLLGIGLILFTGFLLVSIFMFNTHFWRGMTHLIVLVICGIMGLVFLLIAFSIAPANHELFMGFQ